MKKVIILLMWAAAVRLQGAGFPSLEFGADARFAALGNAGVAWTDDASAGFRNPALMVFSASKEMEFSMNRWIQGVKSGFLGFAFKGERSGGGFHLLYTEVGDIPYRSTAPSPEPIGTFSSHELAAGISAASALSKRLTVGVNLKLYYEKIFVEEALGLGCDVGLLYELSMIGLRVGGVVQNIGKTAKLAVESIELPLTGRIGFALPVESSVGDWLVLTDGVKEKDSPFHLHGGVEYAWKNALFLRSGYQTGYETHGWSGGIGFAFSKYRLDYSYMPWRKGLGESHRFSVNLAF
jgi:hypothetical protein